MEAITQLSIFFPVCVSWQKLTKFSRKSSIFFLKKLKIFLFMYLLYVCMYMVCVFMWCVHADGTKVWRSEDCFWELVFSSRLWIELRWPFLHRHHFYSVVSLQPLSLPLPILLPVPPPPSPSPSPSAPFPLSSSFWVPRIEPSASQMLGTGTLLHWIMSLTCFFSFVLWCIFFFEKGSCTSDCPQTWYVLEAHLKILLGLLVLPLEC